MLTEPSTFVANSTAERFARATILLKNSLCALRSRLFELTSAEMPRKPFAPPWAWRPRPKPTSCTVSLANLPTPWAAELAASMAVAAIAVLLCAAVFATSVTVSLNLPNNPRWELPIVLRFFFLAPPINAEVLKVSICSNGCTTIRALPNSQAVISSWIANTTHPNMIS